MVGDISEGDDPITLDSKVLAYITEEVVGFDGERMVEVERHLAAYVTTDRNDPNLEALIGERKAELAFTLDSGDDQKILRIYELLGGGPDTIDPDTVAALLSDTPSVYILYTQHHSIATLKRIPVQHITETRIRYSYEAIHALDELVGEVITGMKKCVSSKGVATIRIYARPTKLMVNTDIDESSDDDDDEAESQVFEGEADHDYFSDSPKINPSNFIALRATNFLPEALEPYITSRFCLELMTAYAGKRPDLVRPVTDNLLSFAEGSRFEEDALRFWYCCDALRNRTDMNKKPVCDNIGAYLRSSAKLFGAVHAQRESEAAELRTTLQSLELKLNYQTAL